MHMEHPQLAQSLQGLEEKLIRRLYFCLVIISPMMFFKCVDVANFLCRSHQVLQCAVHQFSCFSLLAILLGLL